MNAPSDPHAVQFNTTEALWFAIHRKVPRKGGLSSLFSKLYTKFEQIVAHANLPDNHPDNERIIESLIDALPVGYSGNGLPRNHGAADDGNVRSADQSTIANLPGGKNNSNGPSRKSAPKVGGAVRKGLEKAQGAA